MEKSLYLATIVIITCTNNCFLKVLIVDLQSLLHMEASIFQTVPRSVLGHGTSVTRASFFLVLSSEPVKRMGTGFPKFPFVDISLSLVSVGCNICGVCTHIV